MALIESKGMLFLVVALFWFLGVMTAKSIEEDDISIGIPAIIVTLVSLIVLFGHN